MRSSVKVTVAPFGNESLDDLAFACVVDWQADLGSQIFLGGVGWAVGVNLSGWALDGMAMFDDPNCPIGINVMNSLSGLPL